MKIEIKTKFTKMSFEMTEDNANELIARAVHFSQGYLRGQGKKDQPEEVEEKPVVEIAPKPFAGKPVVQSRVESRVERVFGAKSEWATHSSDGRPYRGFLYIKCEKCGREKAYCAKVPTYDHRCECGHYTDLKDLKPAHVNCKCGGSFKYLTNIKDDGFSMHCLNCGSQVDMVLNGRETAFVTFGRPGVW